MKRNHNMVASCLALSCMLVSACTTVDQRSVRATPQDSPTTTYTNFDRANACAGRHLNATLERNGLKILLLIDGLQDETIRPQSIGSGALTNAGGIMMVNHLRKHTKHELVKIPLNQTGSNRTHYILGASATLTPEHYKSLKTAYGVKSIMGVTGGFVAHDQLKTSAGEGVSGTVRRGNVDARAEMGRSGEAGRVTFVLNVGTIPTNELWTSISLTATERKRSTQTRLTIEVDGFGGGFARQRLEADGIHNVQAGLISAAAFQLMAALTGGDEVMKCLYDPNTSPSIRALLASDYEKATERERIRLLQRALNRFHGDSRHPLAVDGLLGPSTLSAARAAERMLQLAPHSRGTLGELYLQIAEAP